MLDRMFWSILLYRCSSLDLQFPLTIQDFVSNCALHTIPRHDYLAEDNMDCIYSEHIIIKI